MTSRERAAKGDDPAQLAKRVAALIGSLPVTLISPGPKDHCDCCAPFGLLPKRSVRELGKSKMVLPGPAPRNTKLPFNMSMRFANM